ncbi:transcriptional regulator, LysR family [Pseudomonas synxantha BG33R]|uniref:LysR substrate-binding domain-containing protein n=1 Tax=Pseudomonas synxantha TaxID=47883 RepID=UPI00025FEECE|nr:LysR substrate-binding domain-containing protein [Pseudomonas synxantha]EIK69084.1 transcriptional regulator, LysR family [Pseudomonas synxantha BG33R]
MDWTRRLRVQHMELLLKLAETGTISETARVCFTTQPALSKWLKELEDGIGTALFERHARGLRLTEQGRMLTIHAQRVLSEMKRAQESLAAISQGSSFKVSIGTSPASAPNLVPDAIIRFLQRHPRANVELQEGTMNHLLERLEQGALDLVVGRLDNYEPRASLCTEMLYSESMRVICRPGHPLTRYDEINWEALYQYEWIVWPRGTPIRARLDAAITAAGRKPPSYRIESSSLIGNLWMLQYSDLLSIASERVAEHFSERGLIVDTGFPLDATGSLGMCWRDDVDIHFSLADLLECLREAGAARVLPSAGNPLLLPE